MRSAAPCWPRSRQSASWDEHSGYGKIAKSDDNRLILLFPAASTGIDTPWRLRSEEHTSELQSLMRISYAVFCLKKKKKKIKHRSVHTMTTTTTKQHKHIYLRQRNIQIRHNKST